MADLSAALATQLHNIQAKTGRTIAALHDELAATGLAKVGEKRNWLMATHKLGYGMATPTPWRCWRARFRPASTMARWLPRRLARAILWMPCTLARRSNCGQCTKRY